MSTAEVPVPLETLLTHRVWVRRLATTLVRDDASADDVEQRTWLAALRRPPRDPTTVRAWLGRVVRNQASNVRRGETRRTVHELTAARPEASRSTDDVVAEAETHKRVVLAVFALAEPYRSTVLLRWFEDLPPRAIAERMGVPVETVRTRLKRAHEVLRQRLGREHGGGSSGCALALAPLVVARTKLVGAAGGAAIGGTAMGAKSAFVLAGAVLVVGGGLVAREWSSDAASETAAASKAELEALRARVDALDGRRAGGASPRGGSATERASRAADPLPARAEEKLAEAMARIETLETKLADANTRIEAIATSRASGAAEPARDPAAEVERLKTKTDDELFSWIRLLVSSEMRNIPTDGKAIVEACDVLLARPLDARNRADALMQKGIGLRVLRDMDGAAASFREAASLVGPTTAEGRQAVYQLAWTASRKGDARVAAESFDALAQDPEWPVAQRARCRIYAGTHFAKDGDSGRAAAQFRACVEEYGASEDVEARKAADISREELKKLTQPGR